MSDKVRKVPLLISGYHITPTGDADVGSTSGNSVVFQPRFDETWDGMSITAKFSDATKTVTIDVLLADDQNADGSWNVPMPHEITQSEGDAELTFVGEAVEDDEVTARQTTKPFKFRVYESNGASVGDNTEPVAASDKQQLFDAIHVSEAYAKGTVNDIPVEEGETGYRDNAKYYAEEIAAGHASDASDSATAAAGSAELAQQWAVWDSEGTPSATKNAKKYAADARSSASSASTSANNAATSETNAGQSELNAAASASDASGYAESAAGSAGDASDYADSARGSAEAAESAAETAAADAAAAAVADAEELLSGYVTDAQSAKTGAETAQGLAEAAQSAAETAQGKAEDAQTAAEAAQTAAETAQGKAETAAAEAKTNIAEEFSHESAYSKGEYVLRNGLLYRFTEDHAAGAWTGEDAEAVKVADDLSKKYELPGGGVPSTDVADGAISWEKMNLNNVREQFAPTFSNARSYAAGEYVFYYDGSNWRLYKALMDVSPGEFDSNSWAALGTFAGGTICGDIARAISASITPGSFAELRDIVRAGNVRDVLDVGDQVVGRIGDTFYDWDVEGIDEEINATDDNAHVLSLVLHNALADFAFDQTQFLFAVTEEACTAFGWDVSVGMPAGKYVVEAYRADVYSGSNSSNGKYVFTTTQAISVGGGVRHSVLGAQNITQEGVLAGNYITYGGNAPLSALETLATTLYNAETDSDATYLGKTTGGPGQYATEGDYINYSSAQLFGSSRWSTSVIRHWLNSDSNNYAADFAASKPTIWSRPFDTMPQKGFLAMLDPAIRAVLVPIRKRYAFYTQSSTVFTYEDIVDLVTLDTVLDVFNYKNNNINYPSVVVAEGSVNSQEELVRDEAISYWAARTSDADKIRKTKSGTAKKWWLGSLLPGSLRYARQTSRSGTRDAQSSFYATNGGVLPRIQIG